MRWLISDEHTLEYRLGYDGRIHYLEHGYWLKFEIKRGAAMPERPHGLRYSFTLHAPNGKRLMDFDNAHGMAPVGGRYRRREEEHDHWHRHGDDPGRPYKFTTADQLLADFEREVRRILAERGVSDEVIDDGDTTERGTG
jgi:hypothetical protein